MTVALVLGPREADILAATESSERSVLATLASVLGDSNAVTGVVSPEPAVTEAVGWVADTTTDVLDEMLVAMVTVGRLTNAVD